MRAPAREDAAPPPIMAGWRISAVTSLSVTLLVRDDAAHRQRRGDEHIAHEVDDRLPAGAAGRAARGLGEGQPLVRAVGRRLDVAQPHLVQRTPRAGEALGAEPGAHRGIGEPRERRVGPALLDPGRQRDHPENGRAGEIAVEVERHVEPRGARPVEVREHEVGLAVEVRDEGGDPASRAIRNTSSIAPITLSGA